MAIQLVQFHAGVSTSGTVAWGFDAPTATGNLIVGVFASDALNGSPTSGWQQSSEMEQQGFHGSYIWWRISEGETNPQPYTIDEATNSAWILLEFSGIAAQPYDGSEGQITNFGSDPTYTTPTLTPTAGDRLLVAAINGSLNQNLSSDSVGSWTNSFSGVASIGSGGSGTNNIASAAYRVVTANGLSSFSAGATFSRSMQSRSGLIIAFKASEVQEVTGSGSFEVQIDAGCSGGGTAVFSPQDVSGTGSFSVGELQIAQTGAGTVEYAQEVLGSGDFAVELEAAQTGEGTVDQTQHAEGSGSWAVELEASQIGSGASVLILADGAGTFSVELEAFQSGAGLVDQPRKGTGDFSVSIVASQSGEGASVLPIQEVSGTGAFSASLSVEQTGSGVSIVPIQDVTGTGAFGVELEVSHDGDGHVHQMVYGLGVFGASLSVAQSGAGTSVPRQEASGSGTFALQLAALQTGFGDIFVRQKVIGTGEWLVGLEFLQDGHGVIGRLETPVLRTGAISLTPGTNARSLTPRYTSRSL